jgi:Spy/CpxP family protein refolding chaperone
MCHNSYWPIQIEDKHKYIIQTESKKKKIHFSPPSKLTDAQIKKMKEDFQKYKESLEEESRISPEALFRIYDK